MVVDVLDALRAASEIGVTIVVSGQIDDSSDDGFVVVRDEHDQGQSPAALAGMARARELGYARAVLVPGDCPLLDPADVDALSCTAAGRDVVIVPDRHGTGTNALALDPAGQFEPSFGPGSLDRHAEQARRLG